MNNSVLVQWKPLQRFTIMAKKKRDEREREKMVNNEGKTFKKAEKT